MKKILMLLLLPMSLNAVEGVDWCWQEDFEEKYRFTLKQPHKGACGQEGIQGKVTVEDGRRNESFPKAPYDMPPYYFPGQMVYLGSGSKIIKVEQKGKLARFVIQCPDGSIDKTDLKKMYHPYIG